MYRNLFLSVLMLSLAANASGGYLGFLGDSILADISVEEVTSLKQKIRSSLDDNDDKEPVVWHNSEGDISISIIPKLSYQLDGVDCRRTQFLLKGKFRDKERYTFALCNKGHGWEISPSPMNSFTEEDLRLFAKHLYDTLADGAYGVPASWVNPTTNNLAVVVPLEAISSGERTCRNTSISVVDKKGRSADGHYIFCQREDGKWRRP